MGWIHFMVPDLVSGRCDGDEVEAEMRREASAKVTAGPGVDA